MTSIKRLSNLKEQKIDTNLKRMLRTVMKQLFNCTLLRLKAFIPNPKGYTHKTRFACDRNLNDKIKFKKSKEKKRKIEEKGEKMYKITDAKLRWRFMETFGVRCPCPRPLISFYWLPWCSIFYLDIISYCRDATFSTLTSFYCRDATFSTLISFYGS